MRQPAAFQAPVAVWFYQLGAGVLLALLAGCRGSQAEPQRTSDGASSAGTTARAPSVSDVAGGSAGNGQGMVQLAAEPEQFRFVVPLLYLPHELRGEGSERVLAPRDAQVRADGHGIRVEAANDF